jgi:hypothetical protein
MLRRELLKRIALLSPAVGLALVSNGTREASAQYNCFLVDAQCSVGCSPGCRLFCGPNGSAVREACPVCSVCTFPG